MNDLAGEGALLEGSRLDCWRNQVTLVRPEGNPAGLSAFDQLAES